MSLQQDKIQEMREKQSAGPLEKIEGNRASSCKIAPKEYRMIRADEADGYVHVFTRIKHMGGDQKSIVFEDRNLTLHKGEFDRKVNEGYFQLFDDIEVVHDPRGADREYNLKPGKSVLPENQAKEAPSANPRLAEREKQK